MKCKGTGLVIVYIYFLSQCRKLAYQYLALSAFQSGTFTCRAKAPNSGPTGISAPLSCFAKKLENNVLDIYKECFSNVL